MAKSARRYRPGVIGKAHSMIHVDLKPADLGRSGWDAILPARQPQPPLEDDSSCDYLIVGAGFAGNLEASVSGINWTVIVGLGASAQGAISDEYNLVRLDLTGGGALGTGTEMIVSGKVL